MADTPDADASKVDPPFAWSPGMTGPELVEAIGTQASLDLFLDRNPHLQPYTDEELLEAIVLWRKLRLEIQAKETKRADRKAGVVEPEPEEQSDE